MFGDAAWAGDVAGIVAEIRQDYIDSEGPVPSAYGRSIGDHARIWGYRYMSVLINSPKLLDLGRVDRKRTLELLKNIDQAVQIIIDERLEQIRTNTAGGASNASQAEGV